MSQRRYPIGKVRSARLQAACEARCSADQDPAEATKHLYTTLRGQFREMEPAIQEALLKQMEEAVGLMRENGLLPKTNPIQPTQATVDELMRLITTTSDSTTHTVSAHYVSTVVDGTPTDAAPIVTPIATSVAAAAAATALASISTSTHTL